MEEQPYIRLDQFLKLVGLVKSGGEAKYLIQHGEVMRTASRRLTAARNCTLATWSCSASTRSPLN